MISILAPIYDIPRIGPLLWSLKSVKDKFELVLINYFDNNEIILNQLNEFRSAFKWSLYKVGQKFELFEILQDNILTLPASCIPYKNSIQQLISEKKSFSKTKLTGASLAFSTNKYSCNLNQAIIDDCTECEDKVYFTTKGFLLENYAGLIKENKETNFIVFSAGKYIDYKDMKVDLMEKNY